MKTYFSALVMLITILVAGCQSKPVTGETVTLAKGSYRNITANELNVMSKDKNFTLINVHIPFAGNIPVSGANTNVDDFELERTLRKAIIDQGAQVPSIEVRRVPTIPKSVSGKAPPLIKAYRASNS